jgi:hypothetical protein
VLARFRDVHGKRYDYYNVVYQHSMRRVEIGCSVHGPFWQRPAAHWLGKGCPACGCAVRLAWAAARVLSTGEAVRRFRQLHGDRYDYSQARYERYRLPLSIVCPHHGLFRQTPQAHLEGKGCPQCAQSSGETRAAAWLRRQGIAYISERSVPLPGPEGAIRYGRFDFYLPERGVFVEIDGPHHFGPVRYAGMSDEDAQRAHEATCSRDRCKDDWAAGKGLIVIRIRWDSNIELALQQHLLPA